MGIGVLLASDDALLSDRLMGLVTEVRVEQLLDEPARFAVRFADDWCDKKPLVRGDEALKVGKRLTIAVPRGSDAVCLVDGKIEDEDSLATLAGPGSWHQVSGRDLRALLEADVIQASYEGHASDVVRAILSHHGFDVDAEPTPKVYDKKTGTLNQSATDLAFVTQLARDHCYGLWVDVSVGGLPERLRVDRRLAHFRPSPRTDAAPSTAGVAKLVIARDAAAKDCVNVTQFHVEKDAKRAARATGKALDDRSGKAQTVEGVNPQPPIEPSGLSLPKIGNAERKIKVVTAGGTDELNVKLSAALSEEAWFVKATFSTTIHMLHRTLAPHDLVEVVATDGTDSGLYQVRSVTHVINAADHFMDVELRRNAILGAKA